MREKKNLYRENFASYFPLRESWLSTVCWTLSFQQLTIIELLMKNIFINWSILWSLMATKRFVKGYFWTTFFQSNYDSIGSKRVKKVRKNGKKWTWKKIVKNAKFWFSAHKRALSKKTHFFLISWALEGQKKVQKLAKYMVVPIVFAHFWRFLKGQKYWVRDHIK